MNALKVINKIWMQWFRWHFLASYSFTLCLPFQHHNLDHRLPNGIVQNDKITIKLTNRFVASRVCFFLALHSTTVFLYLLAVESHFPATVFHCAIFKRCSTSFGTRQQQQRMATIFISNGRKTVIFVGKQSICSENAQTFSNKKTNNKFSNTKRHRIACRLMLKKCAQNENDDKQEAHTPNSHANLNENAWVKSQRARDETQPRKK